MEVSTRNYIPLQTDWSVTSRLCYEDNAEDAHDSFTERIKYSTAFPHGNTSTKPTDNHG